MKMGVAQAMSPCHLRLAVCLVNPQTFSKDSSRVWQRLRQCFSLIICAVVFAAGLKSAGLIDAFVNALKSSNEIARWGGSLGPFILSVLVGSGDAATFAFNEAVTPHATEFGMQIPNLGSLALISGALGRTMSPISGAAIVISGLAMVQPLQLVRRTAIPMIVAVFVLALIMV